MTFTEKEIAAKVNAVVLVRGYSQTGVLQYAYVLIRLDRLVKLQEAMATGDYKVQDYGTVVEWGEGSPSQEVMIRMRDEYGFDHDSGLTVDASSGNQKPEA